MLMSVSENVDIKYVLVVLNVSHFFVVSSCSCVSYALALRIKHTIYNDIAMARTMRMKDQSRNLRVVHKMYILQ